ncbi:MULTISPECIES: hypothetical protein [Rhodomicrobium]|uniref:hypothetical protein n=1 Tax=Rhodomicrobium TaxID=1068 RepID=UPI000B4AAB84|nr:MULTISPECIES: hypothetical protein [Rhodomicrobium]
MSSVVRSVLGAALLLTGATAAMAAPGTPQAAGQAGAPAAATNSAPVAYGSVQTGASAAIAAPAAVQPKKAPPATTLQDNNDPNGGHDPNSAAGMRAFFAPQY